jgi:uncharacterized membrane protein YebE (DUF533 family)
MITRLAVAALAAALALPAFAQTSGPAATPGIDQRQANQEQRIDQGVASGQLTKPETRRLEQGQNHVERMETRAKSDGVVTKQERGRIHHAQDTQSKRIYRQKHDSQARPRAN